MRRIITAVKDMFRGLSMAKEIEKRLKTAVATGNVITLDQILTEYPELDENTIRPNFERAVLQGFTDLVNDITSDGRFDDREYRALEHMVSAYDFTLPQIHIGKLASARRVFLAETKPLSPITSGYNLKRGETCYFSCAAEALEVRSRTVRTNYSSASVRIPIVKGFSYRIGSVRSSSIREDFLHSFGGGELAITDQRVIISCPNKNIALRLDGLINVDYFNDGLTLHKTSGKPVLIRFNHDPVAAITLARCLNGSQSAMTVDYDVSAEQPATPRLPAS